MLRLLAAAALILGFSPLIQSCKTGDASETKDVAYLDSGLATRFTYSEI